MTEKKTKSTPDAVDVHVGNRLRVKRSLQGMSQEKLADAIGLTFQQIQKYERGVNRISAGRLFQFSRILEVPISYFYDQMGGETGRENPLVMGLSDNEQQPFAHEENVMQSKETLDLVRTYYSIDDPKKRKDIFRFIRSMASPSSED